MKRWHQDFNVSKRQWKKHRRMHVDSNEGNPLRMKKLPDGTWTTISRVGVSAEVVDRECDEQIGRFRKKDAYDCGHTQCFMCHGDKFPVREPTAQEQVSDLSFREQLKDLYAEAHEKKAKKTG